jgi:hypothetical protein
MVHTANDVPVNAWVSIYVFLHRNEAWGLIISKTEL